MSFFQASSIDKDVDDDDDVVVLDEDEDEVVNDASAKHTDYVECLDQLWLDLAQQLDLAHIQGYALTKSGINIYINRKFELTITTEGRTK